MAKVGTSNQDRTISLKAAVLSCINNYSQKLAFLKFRKVGNVPNFMEQGVSG